VPFLATAGAVLAQPDEFSIVNHENSDLGFRLDCRHIDRGCEHESWHALTHGADAGLTVLALVLARFVLARALKLAPRWRQLWLPTLAFAVGTIAAAVAGGIVGAGLASLPGPLVWFAWITMLAIRMLRLSS
jgi:hypothetical protein